MEHMLEKLIDILAPGILAILVALALYIRAMAKIQSIEKQVVDVHKATNSLVDKLVETTRTEAHAAGMKEERNGTSPMQGGIGG